ncbi:MAG TPA: YkgJ family cysteine cluster protein [Byssovorax sp.]
MARRGASSAEQAALAELDQLYARVDATFAGWSCPASTECCRFGVTGREPYVTSIELAALRRAVAAAGGARAVGAAPAPTKRRRLDLADERPCPLLRADGRCSVYAARPLGCRTFYCDRATEGGRVKHAEVQALVRAVREIAARHEPGGEDGRPLTRAW